jgi:hypothetical protein
MAYPSNCKPIPLDAIQQMIEKVFYEDSSASRRTDSWSLRDTFEEDQTLASSTTFEEDQTLASTATASTATASTTTASTTTSYSGVSQARKKASVLPIDFSPHPFSVICGRGKVRSYTSGNRYLETVAGRYLLEYSQAHMKTQKSSIVSHILEIMRNVCPDGRGSFIRKEKNRWIELSELDARDKITSVMRNALHGKYRSSTQSKLETRRRHQNKARKEEMRTEVAPIVCPNALNKDALRIEDGPSTLSPEMACWDDLCSKYEPANQRTRKDDDSVVDLLSGEDILMEGFFE